MKPRFATHVALAVVLSFGAIGCTRCLASMGEARKASENQEIGSDDGKAKTMDPYTQVVAQKIELEKPVDYETWINNVNSNHITPDGYELLKLQELYNEDNQVNACEVLLTNAKRVEKKVVINPETGEEEHYYEVIDDEVDNTKEESKEDNKVLTK